MSAAELTVPSGGYQLQVSRVEFKAGLRALKDMAKTPAKYRLAQISMEFDGRFATFTCPGVAFSVNATGDWPGRVTFSSSLMLGLYQVPPLSDPIRIRSDTKRLWIDTTSIACSWQAAVTQDGDDFVSLPEPMDRLHMLRMLASYSKDELYKQGFQKHIKRAKAWRYLRIVKALESLAELGVTYDDLAHVVEQALRRSASER